MGSGTYSKARINAQTKGLRAYYSRLSRQRDGLTGEERDREYRKEKADRRTIKAIKSRMAHVKRHPENRTPADDAIDARYWMEIATPRERKSRRNYLKRHPEERTGHDEPEQFSK